MRGTEIPWSPMGHSCRTTAKTCHAVLIQPGTSHNGFNVYVVPWQTASLTLLR